MQQPTSDRIMRNGVRTRHTAHRCACCECGRPVYPYPLPLSSPMRLVRGYPAAHAELDRRGRAVRFDARMRCVSCTPPAVVRWWRRWEEMAADLLTTLPPLTPLSPLPSDAVLQCEERNAGMGDDDDDDRGRGP